jgi:hypothetical protein
MTFVDTVFRIARTADMSSQWLTAIISALPDHKNDLAKLSAAVRNGIGADTIVGVYADMIAEMLWCRGVDNFLTYVAHLLGLLFRTRPETLKSSRSETLETILEFQSINELVNYLADKRVYDLTFRGMRDLRAALLRELGYDLFPVEERLERAVLIIEDRNLIAHNRNVVNELYLRRTGAKWAKIGAKHTVGLVCTQRCMRFLAHAVLDIDARAVDKFQLPSDSITDECRRCVTDASTSVPTIGCGSIKASGPPLDESTSEHPSSARTAAISGCEPERAQLGGEVGDNN